MKCIYDPIGRIIASGEMKEGDLGIIQNEPGIDPDFVGQIILKSYELLVSLTNPVLNWTSDPKFRILQLNRGEKVILEVE